MSDLLASKLREEVFTAIRAYTAATVAEAEAFAASADPRALEHLVDTLLARMDSLVMDLQKNPRKYINLKIF